MPNTDWLGGGAMQGGVTDFLPGAGGSAYRGFDPSPTRSINMETPTGVLPSGGGYSQEPSLSPEGFNAWDADIAELAAPEYLHAMNQGEPSIDAIIKKLIAAKRGTGGGPLTLTGSDQSLLQKLLSSRDAGFGQAALGSGSPVGSGGGSGSPGEFQDWATNADFHIDPYELAKSGTGGVDAVPTIAGPETHIFEGTPIGPGKGLGGFTSVLGKGLGGLATAEDIYHLLSRPQADSVSSDYDKPGPPSSNVLRDMRNTDFNPNTLWGDAATPERVASTEADVNKRHAVEGLKAHMASLGTPTQGDGAHRMTPSVSAATDGQDPALKKSLHSILGGPSPAGDPRLDPPAIGQPKSDSALERMIHQRLQAMRKGGPVSPGEIDKIGGDLYHQMSGKSGYDSGSPMAVDANRILAKALNETP